MKLPIPNDWDGTSWRCVQVQWPDSQQYTGVLLGLLSLLTRGRLWDEQTGSIIAAQAVGWQIFNANYPLVPCAGDDQNGAPQPQNGLLQAFGVSCADDQEDTMGQVVTDVTVNADGSIRVWFGACCYKDLSGIAVSDVFADVGDTPLVPTGGDPPTYSACGKAWAIVRSVRSVLDVVYIAFSSLTYPWQFLGYVEDNVGYNLIDKWVAALATDWLVYGAVVDPDQVFSDNDQAEIACRLVNIFEDDEIGVPDAATYDAVYGTFSGANFVYDGLIKTAVRCLGRANLDTIAKLAAGDTESTCDCPAADPGDLFWDVGVGHDWRYVYDFRVDQGPFTTLGTNTRWTEGLGFWAVNQVSDHIAKIEAEAAFNSVNNGSTLEFLALLWENTGDEHYISGCHLGVNSHYVIGPTQIIAVGGDNPANAGTFQYIATDSFALGAGIDKFMAGLEAEHLTDVSQKLIGVIFAGSGPGPMA